MRWKHPAPTTLLASIAFCLSGCADSSSPIAAPFNSNGQVVVSPKTATLEALGDTVRMSATARRNGVVEPSFVWSSLNPVVATVDEQGRVVALAIGETRIVAQTSTGADTALVAVTQVPASVRVRRVGAIQGNGGGGDPDGTGDENSAEMDALGDAVQFEAIVRDRRNNVITDAPTTWTSLDPEVVEVQTDGTVYAAGNGEARVVGRSGNATDTAKVVVKQKPTGIKIEPSSVRFTALGDTASIDVITMDRNGQLVESRIFFSSLRPSVATVSSNGTVTAMGNGTTSVIVSGSGVADTMQVTVLQSVSSVVINPSSLTVATGTSASLTATAYDSHGVTVPGVSITWSSSNTAIAVVDAGGRVTGRTVGTTTISALGAGFSAHATVTVSALSVASVTLSPTSANLSAGQTLQLNATLRDANYTTLTGRAITWTSSQPSVAAVSSTGVVAGVSDGNAVITATSEGRSASASVTVRTSVASVLVQPAAPSLTVGNTMQLTATPKDAAGNTLTNRIVTWTSSNAAVASVDPNGLITAKVAGTTNVYATSEGVIGISRVTVTTPTSTAPVASVTLTPTSHSLAVGGTVTIVPVLKDAQGNILSGRSIHYASSNPAVATVNSAGTVTALKVGTTTITVRSEEKSATAAITVTTAPSTTSAVARVVLTPVADTLDALGATTQVTAVAYDVNGAPIPGAAIQWQAHNQTVATVSEVGVVTGRSIGTALIIAVSAACADTAAVVVRQLVDSVSVQPVSVTIQPGASFRLSAQAYDSRHNPISTAPIVWSTANPAIATVDGAGNVTAVSVGSTTVRASQGTVSASTTVNVQTSTTSVASLVLGSTGDTLNAINATKQLTATPRSSTGTTLTGVSLNWTSSNLAVATVSSTGVVTAKSVGSAQIVAATACCTLADTTTLVVRQVVASVAVTPTSSSLLPGATVALTATVKDANGFVVPSATLTWATSAPTVATVDALGNVAALTNGTASISATASGRSASASITVGSVVTPPPPPPPTQAGGLLFSDNFDAGKKTNANGYNWAGTPLNVNVSTDIAHSGTHSLRFTYPGKPSPCGDATAEQRLAFGHDLREAWFEYYIYFPNGTEGLGAKFIHRLPACPSANDPNGVVNNNKFFAIWDTDYANQDVKVVFEYRRTTTNVSGPDDSYIYGMWGTDTRKSARYGTQAWDPAIADATRGRWIQIRIHVKTADDKVTANGRYRMWADGKLVIDAPNRDLAPLPGGNNFFRNMYLMGWSDSGFTDTTNVYIDSFKIFGVDPGW